MTTDTQHPKAARIGALLRKAENTDNEHEAEAYMTAAQKLATEYRIDLELARLAHDSRQAPPVPTSKQIKLGTSGKRGLFTYVILFQAIAEANGVSIDIARNSTYVIAYGFDTDIDTVEMLYNSLIVQMVHASDAFIRSGAHRQEEVEKLVTRRNKAVDRFGNTYTHTYQEWAIVPVATTTARISFQKAFAQRIFIRLQEAKWSALREAGKASSGAELVLVGRDQAVEVYYKATTKARGKYRGGQGVTAESALGQRAGDDAGRSARLGQQRSIGGERTAISA